MSKGALLTVRRTDANQGRRTKKGNSEKWWSRWELGSIRAPSARAHSTPGRSPFARITLARGFFISTYSTHFFPISFFRKSSEMSKGALLTVRRTEANRGRRTKKGNSEKMVEPVGIGFHSRSIRSRSFHPRSISFCSHHARKADIQSARRSPVQFPPPLPFMKQRAYRSDQNKFRSEARTV